MTARSALLFARSGVRCVEAAGVPAAAAGRSSGPRGPGPAGDPGRADRGAVLRSALPARHHHDSGRSPGLPVGLCGRRLRAAAHRRVGLVLGSSGAVGRQSVRGTGMAAFVTAAHGLDERVGSREVICRICPGRPAAHSDLRLCQRHLSRWAFRRNEAGEGADFALWVSQEQPCPGYGPCGVVVCPSLADPPLGLCAWHGSRYRRDGAPGGAAMPGTGGSGMSGAGSPFRLSTPTRRRSGAGARRSPRSRGQGRSTCAGCVRW